ncbi:hypothetical protein KGF56_003794 [Candida oxycetoniae]|uniref:Elongator complex protein 6 n=1 Tax=Candida oxycetoniae TaxID=497107 RepID=A0AAI9SUL8_9ASCO|nr:uncharacterized protein KGF56_003794 [Candida oxycetoniae]KAI3403373.1 hypothetical protein KGF56_003794 [Candida oxycetoniae]
MSYDLKQDLVLFKNYVGLIPEIVPGKSYLSIITYNQSTSPNWLVNSLIENALIGTASLINQELKHVHHKSNVVLISFLHNENFYIKNCRKNGLDLTQISSFTFVDYFTHLFQQKIKDPNNASEDVKGLFDIKVEPNSVIIIDAPETLLYSTNISSNDLLSCLLKLNKKCYQMYITSCKNSPQLVDYAVNEIINPTYKITDFITKLLFRSHLNITLEPLATGRAKDITGSLVVSRGVLPYDSLVVNEREYAYNITKDSNVKIFFR